MATRILTPSLRGKKRQVSLTAEVSPTKKNTVHEAIIPSAIVTFDSTSPSTSEVPKEMDAPYARTIQMTFNLRSDPNAYFESKANRDLLLRIFPNTIGLAFTDKILSFYVTELPHKPWPLTVAGVPIFISTTPSANDPPKLVGSVVQPSNGHVARDFNGANLDNWDALFEVIRNHFDQIGVCITAVMYRKNHVTIVLRDRKMDKNNVPYKIANIRCFYAYNDELQLPKMFQARHRRNDLLPGKPDESVYDVLRPGVVLSSGRKPNSLQYMSTSSGVLVRDEMGAQFLTAAKHGFPDECGLDVIHSTLLQNSHRSIGHISKRVGNSDIALVKLRSEEVFQNELFLSEDFPNGLRLKQLLTADHLRAGDEIYMDTPYTGCIPGTYMYPSYVRIPADNETQDEQPWVFASWFYSAQNESLALPDSICGSAVVDFKGSVIGFFCFASGAGPLKDLCMAIGVNDLIKEGYTLV